MSTDPFLAGIDGTQTIWDRLARPVEQAAALEALLGAPRTALANLGRILIAGGAEAQALLDRMPSLTRSLRNSTGKRPERRRGEVRGAILWSETLSARAASFGADDLYVCAAPYRDFDVAENRILAYVLDQIVRAGDDVRRMPPNLQEGELARKAQVNRDRARRFLAMRSLSGLTVRRPAARDVTRTRTSRDADTYREAIAVLGRVDDPIRFADLLAFVDRRTRVQHGVLVALADELAARGVAVPSWTLHAGGLWAGPLAYRHPNNAGTAGLHGILLGSLLVDVPHRVRERDPVVVRTALERRAGGRPCAAVLSAEDIPMVVAQAVALGLR